MRQHKPLNSSGFFVGAIFPLGSTEQNENENENENPVR